MKFVSDKNLSKLNQWLRMYNIESLYPPSNDDNGVLYSAARNKAILLTIDRELAHKAAIKELPHFVITSKDLDDQLSSVVKKFNIKLPKKFGSPVLCPICNGILVEKNKKQLDDISKEVKNNHDKFWQCGSCTKIYWKGKHWIEIERRLEKLKFSII